MGNLNLLTTMHACAIKGTLIEKLYHGLGL